MKKLIWIFKASAHMRKVTKSWKPKDLAFCWETASVIYENYEYEGRIGEIGDPAEEVNEELSCWSE